MRSVQAHRFVLRQTYTLAVMSRLLERFLIILGGAGLFVSGVLTVAKYTNVSVPCGPSEGCLTVAKDPSSEVFGIPVALIGFLAYCVLTFVASLPALAPALSNRVRPLGLVISILGTAISGYLTYYAISVIGATCWWCIASAVVMSLTLITYLLLLKHKSDAVARLPMGGAFFGATIFAATCGIILVSANLNRAPEPASEIKTVIKVEDLVKSESYFLGNKDAPITVIEYADFYCPACREMYPQIKAMFQQAKGKIRLAFRHLPYYEKEGHEQALSAAVIAEYAATKGKYWLWIDTMFTADETTIKTYPQLLALAKKIGMDDKEIADRIKAGDDSLLNPITVDIENSKAMKIASTPSYVVFATGHAPRGATMSQLMPLLAEPDYEKLVTGRESPMPAPTR